MAVNPFDEATKTGILGEAKRRATASGRTAEQELYGYAKTQNISDADLDTYMGMAPGQTANFAKVNNGAGMTGKEIQGIINVNNMRTVTPAGSNLGEVAAPQGNSYTPAATSAPYVLPADQRTGIVAEAQRLAAISGRSPEQELYNYAQTNGIKDADLDTYMGMGAGQTANFARANGGQGGIPAAQGNSTGAQPMPREMQTAFITEANKRATANGTTVAAEIAKAAAANGLSMADAEIMMGYAPGTLTGGGGAGGGVAGGGTTATTPAGTTALGTTVVSGVTPGAKLTDPSTWVTTADQTVAGQLPGIMDPNNPLMQRARTNARVSANSRGLLNSTIAESGADAAMNDIALQIANADAAQGSKVANFNASTQNQFTMADKSQGFDLAKMDRQAAITLNQMSAEQQNTIARMAKQQGYDLDKMTAAQINDLARLDKTQNFTDKMADKAQVFDLAKMDRAASITLGQMTAEQQNVVARLAVQQGYNLDTISANQVNDLGKLAATVAAQDKQAETKYGYDRGLVEIQKASNLEIAGIDARYRQQIQGSASATSIMNQLPLLIAKVMDNKDTTTEAKQAQINYYVATSTAALKLAGQFAGDIDLGGALDGILSIAP